MDFMTTWLPKQEQDNKCNSQGKKCGLEERVHLRGGEAGDKKRKAEFLPKKV